MWHFDSFWKVLQLLNVTAMDAFSCYYKHTVCNTMEINFSHFELQTFFNPIFFYSGIYLWILDLKCKLLIC